MVRGGGAGGAGVGWERNENPRIPVPVQHPGNSSLPQIPRVATLNQAQAPSANTHLPLLGHSGVGRQALDRRIYKEGATPPSSKDLPGVFQQKSVSAVSPLPRTELEKGPDPWPSHPTS